MITVSENAKQHALSLITNENSPEGTFIRVGVNGGGCSGLTYKLALDNVITKSFFCQRQSLFLCLQKSDRFL